MHDFDLTVSPYNGHMLRNLSKYCLFICCKQSSSTHFCHFLTTAFVTDVLAGSNPMRWAQKRKAPIAGSLSNQWWAMRDVRVRLHRPHPLRRFAPRVLRWKTLRVSSAPHPCGFESHEMGPNKNGPLSRTVSNSMVGDEGCPRAASPPAPRFGPAALACCAGKRFAFPQLRTLAGSNPMKWAQTKTVPFRGPFPIQWWAMRDSNPQPCACKAPALTVAPIARRD